MSQTVPFSFHIHLFRICTKLSCIFLFNSKYLVNHYTFFDRFSSSTGTACASDRQTVFHKFNFLFRLGTYFLVWFVSNSCVRFDSRMHTMYVHKFVSPLALHLPPFAPSSDFIFQLSTNYETMDKW